MTTRDSEIGIVGAGPAGARVAELLAEGGAGVVLFDPKAPWEKPCGGGLTASAVRSVPELRELRSRARRIENARIESSRGRGVTVPLDAPLWILPRVEMGRWQLARARGAGAEFVRTTIRGIEDTEHGWTLLTDSGESYRTRFLVGADGAASLVRRAVSSLSVELMPTRVTYLPGAGPAPDSVVFRFYPGVPGYLWDFPRPDHRSVGAGVETGVWKRPQFDGEIDRYRELVDGCRCSGAVRAGAVIGTAGAEHPAGYSGIGGRDWALLGDAAGLADPTTGEGIRNALRSGALLAEAYLADGNFASYPGRADVAFERELRVSRLAYRLLYSHDLAARLAEAAVSSRAGYGLVAAIANMSNEHDASMGTLLRFVVQAFRAGAGGEARSEGGRKSPSPAAPTTGQPECGCGCRGTRSGTAGGGVPGACASRAGPPGSDRRFPAIGTARPPAATGRDV